MYKDCWLASWMLPRIPWDATPATMRKFAPGLWDPNSDPAELYYLPDDFSQARDLAARHPRPAAGPPSTPGGSRGRSSCSVPEVRGAAAAGRLGVLLRDRPAAGRAPHL